MLLNSAHKFRFFDQFFVSPPLCDSIVSNDKNLVCSLDRGESVCDRDGCSVFSENFQTLLNPAFTFVVQCAGGLIKDQDRRIFQEHAGNGDPLFLTAGKTGSAFSHKGVIAIRQTFDEIVNICFSGSIDDLIHRGFGFP